MFDWFWKRIFNTKRVGFLMQQAMPHMEEEVKNMIHKLLEDEDIAKHITMYTDMFYSRYEKKFWGTIGGRQKGINSMVDAEVEAANPLSQIFDEDGNISLSSIIKRIIKGGFSGGGSTPPGQQGLNERRNTPNMQRI